jgi:hypothetical protein
MMNRVVPEMQHICVIKFHLDCVKLTSATTPGGGGIIPGKCPAGLLIFAIGGVKKRLFKGFQKAEGRS